MRSFSVILKALYILLYSAVVYNFTKCLPVEMASRIRYRSMLRQARRIAIFFRNKRGIYLKTAQYLSSVSNLFAADLAQIFSEVPLSQSPQKFSDIRLQIEGALHKPLAEFFSVFEEKPIATASFGQVHQAKLEDGQIVAVKVLHKNMRAILRKDLRTLRSVVLLIRLFYPRLDFRSHLKEFSQMASQEIDYVKEAENLRRAYYHFQNDPQIVIPKVIERISCSTVICTEFIDGVWLLDLFHPDREPKIENFLSATERKELIANLLHVYKEMIFENHFYHADPHPGNIVLTNITFDKEKTNPDSKPRHGTTEYQLGFIDFGASMDVPVQMLNRLRECIDLMQNHDIPGLIDLGIDMGIFEAGIDREKYTNLLELIHSRFSAFRFSDVHRINLARFGQVVHPRDLTLVDLKLRDFLVQVRMPRKYIYLSRTLSLLMANARNIDPAVNVLEIVEPYLNELKTKNTKIQYRLARGYFWRGIRRLENFFGASNVSPVVATGQGERSIGHSDDVYRSVTKLARSRSHRTNLKKMYLILVILFSGLTVYLGEESQYTNFLPRQDLFYWSFIIALGSGLGFLRNWRA